MRFSPRSSSDGAKPIVSASRKNLVNKRDTVDFLQCRLALAHGIERRVAQQAGAVAHRRFLELAHRGAGGDQLAQLVVEDHQLGDRLAAAVAGAAALAAALAELELPAGNVR